MNNIRERLSDERDGRRGRGTLWGLTLIGIGAFWLLGRTGLVPETAAIVPSGVQELLSNFRLPQFLLGTGRQPGTRGPASLFTRR